MDLAFTQDEVDFRNEVRDFCKSQLPESLRRKQIQGQRLSREDVVNWQKILDRKGWAAPLWPCWTV